MGVVFDEVVGTVEGPRRSERAPAPPEDGGGQETERVVRRVLRDERRRAARLRAD